MDRDKLKGLFKNNYKTDTVNDELRKLEKLQFISLQKQKYVRCVNRNDGDFVYLTEDQKNCTGIGIVKNDLEITTCHECNRPIRIQNKKVFRSFIVNIIYLNLRSYLINKIREFLELEISNNSHILLKNNDKIYKICFLDLCQDIDCKTSFYYGDDILYTFCDYSERINAENVIWIIDLLLMDDDRILDFILSKAPSNSIENIEKVLNEHVDKINAYQFEELITKLLNYIANHPKELNKGINFLNKYSGSLVASFSFKIGGAGRVDGRTVNLKEYFNIALKSNISLESKHSGIDHYKTAQITHQDIKQYITQSIGDPGVLFSNRENIASSSIDALHQYKEKMGFWKYIVIHRPLLKLFFSLFASEFWNDPNCLNHV